MQVKTLGTPSPSASVSALWGPKALAPLTELDITFTVPTERAAARRMRDRGLSLSDETQVRVKTRQKFGEGHE